MPGEIAPVEACEVIIVLGAAVWPGGQPSPALRRRVLHAVDLLRQRQAGYLLVTGGMGQHPPSEASVMQRLAMEQGIPHTHIFLEEQATSTFESAVRCSAICRQHGWTRVIVVTDDYHLARALFVFRRLGMHVLGSAAPERWSPRRWWKRWYERRLREWFAMLWYMVLIIQLKIRRRLHAG